MNGAIGGGAFVRPAAGSKAYAVPKVNQLQPRRKREHERQLIGEIPQACLIAQRGDDRAGRDKEDSQAQCLMRRAEQCVDALLHAQEVVPNQVADAGGDKKRNAQERDLYELGMLFRKIASTTISAKIPA